jgi:asparagine synthase (glutamine-hydrolysing)
VLLDQKRKILFAARDRFGVKPLYTWTAPDGTIVFASEIKQFTVLPHWRAQAHPQRLYDLLAWRLLDHSSETCFAGVHQIPPGHFVALSIPEVLQGSLRVSAGSPLATQAWYQLPRHRSALTFEEAALWLRGALDDAVRLRLRADVSVGSCLSGGLDSSAIVCLAHQQLKSSQSAGQHTYSSCSHDAASDERRWAEMVVEHTQVTPHYLYPEAEGFFAVLPQLVWHHDEPFDSHGIYAYWRMMEAIQQDGMKVILNGQGADEQLAGYAPFLGARLAGLLKRGALQSFWQEVQAFGASQQRSSQELVLRAIDQLLPQALQQPLRRWRGEMHERPDWFLWQKLGAEPRDPFRTLGTRQASVEALSRAQLGGANLQMLLHYEDRLSMAHGVEVRVPFLDVRFVEGVAGLPEDFRLAGGEMKRVLREALRGVVPEPVRTRPDKKGFTTPLERWMRHEQPQLFRNQLQRALRENSDWFDQRSEDIVLQILDGKRPFSLIPWRILSVAAWRERFGVV